MILFASLAALALGTAPAQTPNPAQPPAGIEPAKAQAVATPGTATAVAPVWKPKPKPWLALGMAKPEDKAPVEKF